MELTWWALKILEMRLRRLLANSCGGIVFSCSSNKMHTAFFCIVCYNGRSFQGTVSIMLVNTIRITLN